VTDFVNLKNKMTQSFRAVYRDRIYIHIFIEVSIYTCINISFVQKINPFKKPAHRQMWSPSSAGSRVCSTVPHYLLRGRRLSSKLEGPGCYFKERVINGNYFVVRCAWSSSFRSSPSHLPPLALPDWATTTGRELRIARLDSGARRASDRIVSEVSSRARALLLDRVRISCGAVRCSFSCSWWVEPLGVSLYCLCDFDEAKLARNPCSACGVV
jgi:hypothetical protein